MLAKNATKASSHVKRMSLDGSLEAWACDNRSFERWTEVACRRGAWRKCHAKPKRRRKRGAERGSEEDSERESEREPEEKESERSEKESEDRSEKESEEQESEKASEEDEDEDEEDEEDEDDDDDDDEAESARSMFDSGVLSTQSPQHARPLAFSEVSLQAAKGCTQDLR